MVVFGDLSALNTRKMTILAVKINVRSHCGFFFLPFSSFSSAVARGASWLSRSSSAAAPKPGCRSCGQAAAAQLTAGCCHCHLVMAWDIFTIQHLKNTSLELMRFISPVVIPRYPSCRLICVRVFCASIFIS